MQRLNRWSSMLLVLAGLLLGAPVSLAQPAASTAPAPPAAPARATAALAVAEFERVPPASPDVPDVGALLADRLATLGVERVVGPARLQGAASAEPTNDEVRGWAARARVGAIVVGRTTRDGSALSIQAHLRNGSGGAAVGSYSAAVPRPEDLVSAVDLLANQIVSQGLPALASANAPPKTDVASPAPSAAKSGSSPGALPIDMGGLKKDAPLNIQSDELEAFQNDKTKRFLFTGNVRVSQDVMNLKADRLEAFYPPNSNDPDRLVATGRVIVSQKDQEARCDTATYLKTDQRIFCRGNAEMRQGDDRVRGKEIEIRLDTDQLIVRGGAEVHIQPKPKEGAPAPTVIPSVAGGREG
jgi:lipopolysaccharide export system protein LptA